MRIRGSGKVTAEFIWNAGGAVDEQGMYVFYHLGQPSISQDDVLTFNIEKKRAKVASSAVSLCVLRTIVSRHSKNLRELVIYSAIKWICFTYHVIK
jgi:hypothetical protein